MSKANDRGRLLSGKPFPIRDGLKLYQFQLGEIVDLGYDEYIKCINILTFDMEDIKKDVDEDMRTYFEDVILYDYIMLSCKRSKEFEIEYTKAMSLFLSDEVVFDKVNEKLVAKKNNIIIESQDLELIKKYIKLQNCITESIERKIEDRYNIADNDLARRLIEKIKKEDKAVKELKNRDGKIGNEIDIFDIISSITISVNSLNIINIWELTIYQLYNQLDRSQTKEKYELDLKSLLAGAKAEDIKVEHYIKHLD